jgi:hypothetical protein
MINGKLYDLEKDIAEKNDVAAQHLDVCTELSKKLEAWRQEMKIKKGN